MPLGINVSARFLDEENNEIHNYNDIIIGSAKVDIDGAAIEENNGEAMIQIDDSDIEKILRTKSIILDLKFKGFDDDSMIKITMDDKVSIHVSVFAKGGISLDKNAE